MVEIKVKIQLLSQWGLMQNHIKFYFFVLFLYLIKSKTNLHLMIKFIILITTITILNSCRTECSCEKFQGCLIIQIKKKYTDSIVADTILCSTNNFKYDSTIRESAAIFWSNYYKPPYELVLEMKDSIYKRQKIDGMSQWSETEKYRNEGYECECYK